jgi:hypothetical protein
MRNLWVTQNEPMATWIAHLSPLRHEPQRLLDWLQTVLEAGEEYAVYMVREAPLANYEWDKNGSLPTYLEAQFHQTGNLDLFHFASSGLRQINQSRYRAFARLAYYDLDGCLVETDVDDTGMLLRYLRPDDVDVAAGLMSRCLPLSITNGSKINFRDSKDSIWDLKVDQIRIRFSIMSDIWLPWVRGFLEEVFDPERRYDNRSLALRHTPRLNRFLSLVSDKTLELGGSWELDSEDSRRNLSYMLGSSGIHLDVEPPGGIISCKE